MSRSWLSLCLCLAMVMSSYAGHFDDNTGHSLTLPLGGTFPAFGLYDAGNPPNLGVGTYSWIMILDVNETYWVDTDLCGGHCQVWLKTYSGSYTPTDNNYLHQQYNPGIYMIIFRIPTGNLLLLNVIHEKRVDGQVIPSVLFFRINNPDTTIPSSTGPAINWPGGRGPVGLFIQDNFSSAFLPRQGGWTWTEYDRDVSDYTFQVGFAYHLMTMDGFWIEQSFADATFNSATRTINGSTTTGNYFGSWDQPIMDDASLYQYHFTIPLGGVVQVKLHYIYQIPGDAQIYNVTAFVSIGNSYGSDPNAITNHAMAVHQPVIEIAPPTDSIAQPEPTEQSTSQDEQSTNQEAAAPVDAAADGASTNSVVKSAPTEQSTNQDQPVSVEDISSAANGASSTVISALTIVLGVLVAVISC